MSGSQVSPSEIENCLLSQPDKLITDAVVAGVPGGRTPDKIPHAWVVLSAAGKRLGKDRVLKILDAWHRENLSKYKYLRGIEVVAEVSISLSCISECEMNLFFKSYLNRLLVKHFAEYCRRNTRRSRSRITSRNCDFYCVVSSATGAGIFIVPAYENTSKSYFVILVCGLLKIHR